MSDNHVTHDQLKTHLEPFSKLPDAIFTMQKEVSENSATTRHLAETMSKLMESHEPRITDLEKNQATNNAYWKISGGVLLVLLAAVVGLGFDRLANEPKHTQAQPQATQTGIRL